MSRVCLGEIGAIFGLEISVGSPPLGDPIETLGLVAKDPLQYRAAARSRASRMASRLMTCHPASTAGTTLG